MVKKEILAISFSEPSKDARLLSLINYLEKNSCNITVISLDDKEFLSISEQKGYKYYPIFVCPAKRMLLRWKDFISTSRKFSKKIKADIIIASDLYSLPVAIKFKNINNKLFYDSREIYSALGSLANSPIKQVIHTYIEKYYINKVDEIIVSGKLDAEYLKTYFKHKTPYHIIMNLPPYSKPINSNYIRDKFNIPTEKKIILYQGALMKGRGIELLLEVVKLSQDYVLFIIGDGPEKHNILSAMQNKKLVKKVVFADAVPYESLHQITSSADIGTALFEEISFSYKLALPNKLFEYFMANIPVIASDLPAMREIYEEYEFGKLISANDSINSVIKSIDELIENKEKYINNLRSASEKYNYDAQEQSIIQIFELNKNQELK